MSSEEADRVRTHTEQLGQTLATLVSGLPPHEHQVALMIIASFGIFMTQRYHGVEAAIDLTQNIRAELGGPQPIHRPRSSNVN